MLTVKLGRYFKPDGSNILQFIFLLFYLGNLKEHILTRRSYNGYTLNIRKFGIRKYIILQIIDQGKIYDSKPMDISFLGTRNYTELILSLERLKEKITVNWLLSNFCALLSHSPLPFTPFPILAFPCLSRHCLTYRFLILLTFSSEADKYCNHIPGALPLATNILPLRGKILRILIIIVNPNSY